ncbi:MAG TPA: tetratricopeptide repeat protein, partial [Gemmataceae bacterium]|nr:tetratricopeptide repeat protein [Gemmataceae bacterium]
AELGADLHRFREGRPILARPPSPAGRLWRWARRKPTTAGLLTALLALFLLTAGGGLWLERQQAERQGRAREAVEGALAQLPGLRRQGRWPEAEAVLAQGRSRLDEAGSDDLRRRLARAGEDLRLAAALERIRLTPSIEGSRFDYRGMAEAYARAFERAGLDVRGDEEAVAARIWASDLRPQLVMALDHWALVADNLQDGKLRGRLLRLAEEAQQRLAGAGPESEPPTALVTLLAKKLGQQDGQAEPLLRAAQERHPEDFWLNYSLGEALRERKPAEAVGFYRAALVTRPTVAAVQLEVGAALLRQGQVDEAIRACRKAIELEPTDYWYQLHLGLCWQAKGRTHAARRDWAQAAACSTKAVTAGAIDEGELWFEYAALLLLSGDRPGYVRACAHMIERCGKDRGPRSYHVARACTLAPDAVADASLPGRLAEKELKDSGRDFWSLTEQGALAYRAGRFQDAVPLFEQSLRADSRLGRAVLNWLWLALAKQHLGEAEEARRWLDKSQAWLDQYRDGMPARAEEELGLHLHNWLEAHVLRREAEGLIQSEAPRSRPGL